MSNPRNLKRALIGLTLVAAQVVALPMVGAQSPVHAAAAMTVVKSAVPAPGTTVKMGDTITYSVAVSNTSTAGETLTGLTVNDLVPAGTTYVPNSATITGARTYFQYRDEFNLEAYDNNNGTTNWTSNWIETGDGNGSPTGGDIEVRRRRRSGSRRRPPVRAAVRQVERLDRPLVQPQLVRSRNRCVEFRLEKGREPGRLGLDPGTKRHNFGVVDSHHVLRRRNPGVRDVHVPRSPVGCAHRREPDPLHHRQQLRQEDLLRQRADRGVVWGRCPEARR